MSDIDVSGRLAGKVAIVTGAGQAPGETIGNGKAIALLFARAGAKVCCVDRAADRAAETVSQIEGEGGEAFAIAADITKADEVEQIVSACVEHLGPVDILVNNVGIGGHGDAPAHKLTEHAFDLIVDVNLKSAWLMIKAVLPIMRERKSGAIVNISSLAAIAGATQLAYEVTKSAMNRMTQAVALNGAKHGVRCNAVLPGLMDTPMAIEGIAAALDVPTEVVREQRSKAVPMGHMGTAWDTAHATLFLSSDESRFVSGELLRVDGAQGTRIG
ncbi:MAG: SDR family NAD(P)-dependent oxidoreductase [Alphaproteobacteria bacterium]